MASAHSQTYALPLDNFPRHAHHYSHSLLPERPASSRPITNDSAPGALKKARSHGSLNPPSPLYDSGAPQTLDPLDTTHLAPPMGRPKLRPRGESDLGRPASPPTRRAVDDYGFPRQAEPLPDDTLTQVLTGLLVPLPYVLAPFAYGAPSSHPENDTHSDSPVDRLRAAVSDDSPASTTSSSRAPAILQACALASGTLLLTALIARSRPSAQVLDRRKLFGGSGRLGKESFSGGRLQQIASRVLGVGLPFYAAAQLGGVRTGVVLLAAITSGLCAAEAPRRRPVTALRWLLSDKRLLAGYLMLGILCDALGFGAPTGLVQLATGYLALAVSILVLPPPLPMTWSVPASPPQTTLNSGMTNGLSPVVESPEKAAPVYHLPQVTASTLVASPEDVTTTFLSGTALMALTLVTSNLISHTSLTRSTIVFSLLASFAAACLYSFGRPSALRSTHKVGVAAGCAVGAVAGFLNHFDSWVTQMVELGFLFLTYGVSRFEKGLNMSTSHSHHHHHHHGPHAHDKHSRLTGILLKQCEPGSLVHSILVEKDSRRIAYFGCLNLAFMLVQAFYGFVTGSLGLLTDSIHMFFDCAGLAVGLIAAVMSKWPASARFPYGYGKVDTLSGFGNGIFLILVSFEIILDAFERLWEGHELRRLDELLVVSILGLLINFVGLFAMGHAHAHGHSHGGHDHHHHGDENMHGIFLHILADALGSVAVIISTLLTKWNGWNGWDPLASCIIALLIFFSALPLTYNAGMRLLLCNPQEVEDQLKDTLRDINSINGVVSYSAPRFWLEDIGAAHERGHGDHDHEDECHSHGHDHGHGSHDGHTHGHHAHSHSNVSNCSDHAHSHSHSHSPSPSHDHHHHHGHSHVHSHSHSHSHTHDHDHAVSQKILGVMHVVAARTADTADVQERTEAFLKQRHLDSVLVHVEKEGEGAERCWCGGVAGF
ncbi:cation efflux family-domain-containing protein [Phyllosticta capitalensis]|uniref:Zinc transporter n=1 Tax=Phyllosticta capitalensis TaxID=121624 RepID=A0ABR1YFP9_9PEZI